MAVVCRSDSTTTANRGRAFGLSLLLLFVVGPAQAAAPPLIVVRPVPVKMGAFPWKRGTLGFKVWNGSSRVVWLRSVRQAGKARCGVRVRSRRLHVRLRPHRWTVVRVRRAVSAARTPSRCQGRTLRVPLRVVVK